MYLKLEHKALIEAADLGHVWQDERGNVYRGRGGNRNTGWSRNSASKCGRELLDAGYLRRMDGSETVEATDAGREALRQSTNIRFPVTVVRVA